MRPNPVQFFQQEYSQAVAALPPRYAALASAPWKSVINRWLRSEDSFETWAISLNPNVHPEHLPSGLSHDTFVPMETKAACVNGLFLNPGLDLFALVDPPGWAIVVKELFQVADDALVWLLDDIDNSRMRLRGVDFAIALDRPRNFDTASAAAQRFLETAHTMDEISNGRTPPHNKIDIESPLMQHVYDCARQVVKMQANGRRR